MAEFINFKWQAAENVDRYELWEKAPDQVDFAAAVTDIAGPNFSLDMSGFDQGAYQYKVRGVNQFGAGQFSDPVTVNFILPTKVLGLEYSIV